MKKKSALEVSNEIGFHMVKSITLDKGDVLESCKIQLRDHIEELLRLGERVPVIEIELMTYIKKQLYIERN